MKCVYHAQPRDSLRLPRQISGRLSQGNPVPVLFLLSMFSLFFMASYPYASYWAYSRSLCPRSPHATKSIHLITLSLSRCRCCVKMSRSRPRVTPSLKALLGLHAVSRCPAFHNFITLRVLLSTESNAHRSYLASRCILHTDIQTKECRTARPPLPSRFAKFTNLKACLL